MSKVFGARLFSPRMGPSPESLLRRKTQPYHVPWSSIDSVRTAASAFVDEEHHPITLPAAAKNIRDNSGYAVATGSSLKWKAMEHTGAVDAAPTDVEKAGGKGLRYCRTHFPRLLTVPPVDLEKRTCICTATGGDYWRNKAADRYSIWNYWREPILSRDPISDRCLENSLLLPPSVFSFPQSSKLALVVPDVDKGPSLTGHAALGEGAVRNESARGLTGSPLSSDDCGAPGASMEGTMSGTSRDHWCKPSAHGSVSAAVGQCRLLPPD